MSQLRPAIVLLVLLTLLTTGLAQWWFPSQANGSLIERDGAARGSEQIGQTFSQPGHFWGRPSATTDVPYNAQASGGSNLAASNPALDKAVAERVAALRAANLQAPAAVPVELMTASASGLVRIFPLKPLCDRHRASRQRATPSARCCRLSAKRR